MPAPPKPLGPKLCGGMTYADIKAQGITPDDVEQDWLDDMVKRLFAELKRQLSQVENSKPAAAVEQANLRAANARTLASLERTLERLAKLEQQRATLRETKVAARNDGALAELERRIDRLVAAAASRRDSSEPEQ